MSTIIGLVSTFRLPLQKRDGLDVEAAGGMAEVQKEQESVTDWTLKLWEAWQKSKRSKKV